MEISKKLFGKTKDGQEVYEYKLENSEGNYVKVINYGATVTSIVIGREKTDVCLGYNTIQEYENNGGFLGACIGRVGNRIGQGNFSLGGQIYELEKNDGNNHLHGGSKGFHTRMFDVSEKKSELMFSRMSEDMEEGYPGNLKVEVSYSFDDNNNFNIHYMAVSDKDTPVNLTNHTYFNLSGENDGNILDHMLKIESEFYTENDKNCLPNGNIVCVQGTPFDFRSEKAIGAEIGSDNEQLEYGNGYDHNFVLSKRGMKSAAKIYSPKTGITMKVITDKPGIQFYSGNSLENQMGKSGVPYRKRSGFCLETQYFPNGMKFSHFPDIVLKAGEVYNYTTVYSFVQKK